MQPAFSFTHLTRTVGLAKAYSRLQGSGEWQAAPPPRPPGRRLRALRLWPPLSHGVGAVGPRTQDEAGPHGPGPVCWPATLRRGPGSPVCSAGGLAGGGLEVGQSQCHYQAALDRALCAPCKPHGEQSKEVPPPGLPFGQTDNKHTDGRTVTRPRARQPGDPLSAVPPALLLNSLSSWGRRASSRWPGLTMNPCGSALAIRGVSPLGSALHHPGSSAGPSGQPHARSGGGCEPCVPPFCGQGVCSPHTWPPPRLSRPRSVL